MYHGRSDQALYVCKNIHPLHGTTLAAGGRKSDRGAVQP